MTSSEKDTKWVNLKSPYCVYGWEWYPAKITSINAHEFILSNVGNGILQKSLVSMHTSLFYPKEVQHGCDHNDSNITLIPIHSINACIVTVVILVIWHLTINNKHYTFKTPIKLCQLI
eukprot:106173_1